VKRPEDNAGYAGLAARALRAEESSPAPITLGNKATDVAAVERVLRSRHRSSARARAVAAGLAAVAAIVLVVAGQARLAHQVERGDQIALEKPRATPPQVAMIEGAGAFVELREGGRALAAGETVAAGARLRVAAAGDATLALDTGTRLALAGGASARVTELGAMQKFDLENGTLTADVAKLGPGRRFVIATPDAEVEVKGTRFKVAVLSEPSRCGPDARTSVTVEEGVVTVRYGGSETRVVAGERWPDCSPRGKASTRPRVFVAAPATRVSSSANTDQPERAPDPSPSSTLAEQNDLFAAALAARRRGDVDEARHWLDQLVERYPSGQLAERARAERRRLDEGPRVPAE
jgi:FecR-like protein